MVVFEKEPKTIVIVKSMTKHEIIFKKAVFLWNIQTWYQVSNSMVKVGHSSGFNEDLKFELCCNL